MPTYPTQGTIFARGDGASPEVFTSIGQLTAISPVGQTRNLINVTNLSSAAMEYKKALEDGNEVQLTIQYDPDDTVHAGLRTDMKSDDSRNFRMTLTDSPAQTITFAGQVTSWALGEVTPENVHTLNVTIKPTGDLMFA